MSHLIALFEQHSYLILFIGIFLELMALPISGEVLMSYAGYFVFQGKMNYILALVTVLLSGGAGITVTYWIGKAGGYKLIEKYGKYIHLGPERYKKIAVWFERSGSKLLVFAYFIPGIRHFTGYISGISRMPFRKFIIPAFTGSFLWGFCFITLGKVLGPRWEAFHQAASKYFIIFIIVFVVLLAGFLAYRFYKPQIKNFFIRLVERLIQRLKTIRATEIFLIFLTVVLIGMVILMLGMGQDYLYNEFTQFNEITEYIIKSVVYMEWMNGFLVFQSSTALGAIVVFTIIRIWRTGRNRMLEYILLAVSLLGAAPFHESIMDALSYLQSIGFVGKFQSANFPDADGTILMIFYGTCVFLLVRHAKRNFIHIFVPLIGLIILIGSAIATIASTNVFPSDLVGGYVYGGVWIFFNFLLFEMLRLVLESIKLKML
ncbi:VTT domain-containing protein [Neobacillus ginsengisoli]|uniref:Membrane protein DedA with SNARE-associated domain/cbb3-type cytochrome oxidase subunit 3 n=1 Tax=Neobacillus ginsengisoli TaxID=904295 RepID=A0ABT9XVS7_9BACI|nr:VTT domain-containing protein [Neobacillus ginsengisoli]MDQ0199034.1 membrane protein DedA with SNARE-associated domain/cbb3-type cytochrome oxidase subunit 3 [Neobacillus ginsengisoli]